MFTTHFTVISIYNSHLALQEPKEGHGIIFQMDVQTCVREHPEEIICWANVEQGAKEFAKIWVGIEFGEHLHVLQKVKYHTNLWKQMWERQLGR